MFGVRNSKLKPESKNKYGVRCQQVNLGIANSGI